MVLSLPGVIPEKGEERGREKGKREEEEETERERQSCTKLQGIRG